MKTLGRWLGRLAIVLLLLVVGVWLFGGREPVPARATFDPASIGTDVDAYLEEVESAYPGITDGVQKQVVWAGAPGDKTEYGVVYVHGYQATSQEIRPVPDMAAQDLGANLVLTRLAGHGLDGPSLASASAQDWLNDTAEALAIARRISDRTLVISTSTGGTLVAKALTDPALAEGVAGAVFISPNFRIANPAAALLTLPGARWWGPWVAGNTRSWQPHNALQAKYWTSSSPTVAALPVAALVKDAEGLDFSGVPTPALFMFTDDDQVVLHDATRAVAKRWGGPHSVAVQDLAPDSDPSAHVIAGDILSPGMNETVRAQIIDWFSAYR